MTALTTVISDIRSELQLVSSALLILDSSPPANIPVNRDVCSFWPEYVEAYPEGSGLATTAMKANIIVRLWKNKAVLSLNDPVDALLLALADSILSQFHGDLVNTSHDWYVDVEGETGKSMGFKTGFVKLSGAIYRVIDVDIPIVINDFYTQVK